jgi:hypothetical protein
MIIFGLSSKIVAHLPPIGTGPHERDAADRRCCVSAA